MHAKGESLALLVAWVNPKSDWKALDVGTGAGHTALAFAPHVAHVVALDLVREMLVKTTDLAGRRNITNLETREGDAEVLPFDDASFDLVTCRLAFHHFPRPRQAISQFVRVLRRGGTLGFTDNIVTPDEDCARYYNTFEKLRDPSHHWVYQLERLQTMFEQAGLKVEATRQLTKEFEFHQWADRQHVSPAGKEQLLEMMRNTPAKLTALFRPRWDDGTLYFSLWEAVIVAKEAT